MITTLAQLHREMGSHTSMMLQAILIRSRHRNMAESVMAIDIAGLVDTNRGLIYYRPPDLYRQGGCLGTLSHP